MDAPPLLFSCSRTKREGVFLKCPEKNASLSHVVLLTAPFFWRNTILSLFGYLFLSFLGRQFPSYLLAWLEEEEGVGGTRALSSVVTFLLQKIPLLLAPVRALFPIGERGQLK